MDHHDDRSRRHALPDRRPDDVPPRPPHVELRQDSLEDFLIWAAGTGLDEADDVRRLIADGADDGVVDALSSELLTLAIQDIGRHLTILAVLGESRHPAAVTPLERFVWSEGSITQPATEDDEPATESTTGEMIKCELQFDMSSALRARAVEMLAYLVTPDAVQATLNVIRDHPEAGVRRAAIDAHIFNQGSTQEVLEALAPYVQPEDEPYVNVPHWRRDMDPEKFDRTVAQLMAAEGTPPPPKRAAPPTGKTDARVQVTEPGYEPSHGGEDSRNV